MSIPVMSFSEWFMPMCIPPMTFLGQVPVALIAQAFIDAMLKEKMTNRACANRIDRKEWFVRIRESCCPSYGVLEVEEGPLAVAFLPFFLW